MKTLLFHTNRILFKEQGISTRPQSISDHAECFGGQEFQDVAVAFVCVEKDDIWDDMSAISHEIEAYSKLIGRKVIIVPFAHLSSQIAGPSKAKSLISQLYDSLSTLGVAAGRVGFGTHKSISLANWTTYAHPGDVAFRDSRMDSAVGAKEIFK